MPAAGVSEASRRRPCISIGAPVRGKLKSRWLWFPSGLLLVWLIGQPRGAPFFLVNISPSVPLGLYAFRGGPRYVEVGSLVHFPLPAAAYDFMVERFGRFDSDRHLLKPVVARAGDLVCTCNGRLSVNGCVVGPVLAADAQGQPIPSWHGCRPLGDNELFVVSTRVRQSLDSRIYGPIRVDQVVGVYVPLWAFGSESDGSADP